MLDARVFNIYPDTVLMVAAATGAMLGAACSEFQASSNIWYRQDSPFIANQRCCCCTNLVHALIPHTNLYETLKLRSQPCVLLPVHMRSSKIFELPCQQKIVLFSKSVNSVPMIIWPESGSGVEQVSSHHTIILKLAQKEPWIQPTSWTSFDTFFLSILFSRHFIWQNREERDNVFVTHC